MNIHREPILGHGIGLGGRRWRGYIILTHQRPRLILNRPIWDTHPCDDQPYMAEPWFFFLRIPPFAISAEWT